MTTPVQRGDAELVAGLRAGDQGCLAAVYDRYADRIFDFLVGMLRDRDDAADAMQDTFLLVSGRIGQLRDADRLRPWLYAIARSVALDRMRARSRTRPTEVVIDTPDHAPGPDRVAEQEALRRLVADASEGLADTDRAMLRLHLHGLEGAELGAAMGMSASTVAVRLSRLRDQVGRSLGALLVARLGRRDCPDLDALLGDWDGRFTPLMRKRVARHVDRCAVCGERRGVAASPWALLSGLVVLPAPPELRDRVLDVAHAGTATLPADAGAPVGALDRFARSPVLRAVAAVLVVAALSAGVAFLSGGRQPAPAAAVALAPSTDAVTTTEVPPTTTVGAVAPSPPSDPSSVTSPPPPQPDLVVPPPPPVVDPPAPPPPAVDPPAPPPPPVVDPPPPPPPPIDPPGPPPPRITEQEASPAAIGVRGCRVVRSDVRVTTDTPVTSAVLTWKGAGTSGSLPMQGAGRTWSGSLGPFPQAGTVQWSVTVTGAAGSATGAAQTIVVSPCAVR